jgi:hypothetical protein
MDAIITAPIAPFRLPVAEAAAIPLNMQWRMPGKYWRTE